MPSSKFPKVPKKKRARKTTYDSTSGTACETVPLREIRESNPASRPSASTTPVYTLTDEMKNPIYTKVLQREHYSVDPKTKAFKTTYTYRTVQVNAPPTAQTGPGPDAHIFTSNMDGGTQQVSAQPSGSRSTTSKPCTKTKGM